MLRHTVEKLPTNWARVRPVAMVGIGVGAATLWLSTRGIDVESLKHALSASRPFWTMSAVLSVLATVAAGVVRWRLLFYPDARQRSWSTLTMAMIVGQMLNIALPFRAGEIARAAWVSRAERLAIGHVLGTMAVERLSDLVAVGVTVGALLILTTVPDWMAAGGRALMSTAVLAAALIGLIALRGRQLTAIAVRIVRSLPALLARRLEPLLTSAVDGTRILQHRETTLLASLLAVVVLLLAASTNYLLFVAFDLPVSAVAAILLVIALQIGNTLLPVPGNVGVFHYVTVLTLGTFSVDRESALAYAVVLHLVALGPKVLAGAAILLIAGRQRVAITGDR